MQQMNCCIFGKQIIVLLDNGRNFKKYIAVSFNPLAMQQLEHIEIPG